MTKSIRLKLIELARLRTTWTYTQLNDDLELRLKLKNFKKWSNIRLKQSKKASVSAYQLFYILMQSEPQVKKVIS
ncbi:hypothetical protein GCM10017764_35820 [Sphingobacterium griseoflavum]|uniref:Phage integrase SAM-like domain-containing protein n=1 Tax=Sphingobacterium griseoflavum TaxID=1474952 RepID=A0ABQ3I075_9SPHI|nr:hypothetical protein GCM10017764_35820 [Sphingobacterium griseoflavum]